jgi:hypothetical protein
VVDTHQDIPGSEGGLRQRFVAPVPGYSSAQALRLADLLQRAGEHSKNEVLVCLIGVSDRSFTYSPQNLELK